MKEYLLLEINWVMFDYGNYSLLSARKFLYINMRE
jgi:hypothetical protein